MKKKLSAASTMHFKLHLYGDYYAVQYTSKKEERGKRSKKYYIHPDSHYLHPPPPENISFNIVFLFFWLRGFERKT